MAQQTINLIWDPVTDDLAYQPDTIDLNAGDTLLFASGQGPVNLMFDPPENFAADSISNGTVQVRVLKRAPARICCGVVVDGVTRGFPDHVKFGVKTRPGEGGAAAPVSP
jgi:hypothetical protein